MSLRLGGIASERVHPNLILGLVIPVGFMVLWSFALAWSITAIFSATSSSDSAISGQLLLRLW